MMKRSMDLICPMHAVVATQGQILHAGPTLRKLRPERELVGRPFLEIFDVMIPRDVMRTEDLFAHMGRKLHLRFRDSPQTTFKAIGMPAIDAEGMLLNLSFGISVVEAVQDYALSNTDFAPTDLTIEMLYLVEAKSAAMDASRRLNERLQAAKTAAEHLALTDALTGLDNRRGLENFVTRLIARGGDFALMFVDLDYFKQVNDTLGHAAGDHVLQQVARIMREETRTRDMVSRVGGDEFVLAIDAAPGRDTINRIASRLISRLSVPIMFGDMACRISASIGTVFSRDYATPQIAQLFSDGDSALYASKEAGRGCHTVFDTAQRGAQSA